MKITLISLFVIIVSIVFLLFFLGFYSQKDQAPGLANGSLLKCSEKPNCVCSEYVNDVDHYIEAVADKTSIEKADLSRIVSIIQSMNGVVKRAEGNYVSSTFKSAIFGFVDDFEIRIDQKQGVIHFRSASRVGYSDGGVNKKRVELFKKLYALKK